MAKATPTQALSQYNRPMPNLSSSQPKGHIHADIPRSFTYSEAKERLPLVQKITSKAAKQLAPIQQRIQNMVPAGPRLPGLMMQYKRIVARWRGKMLRLGLFPQGLWQLGFDSGEGWWSWQYPERGLRYFQDYEQSFCERRLLRLNSTMGRRVMPREGA